ncbi:uncharacterized protein PHALS_08053 [Plasmopara halstedii]|uniref:Uncharacterized protein n=1 Tax=Plasmopara halstedii TaxID=4781 RepID=A0A0P1B7F1_PLAHL|nr:uncharacterized protein PHALS_08053 [Plasmopara halstedii]CEG50336.1 hypothetical protein PHALS_08053 [Plasmopara halstedii]|eukprot:XP_024586705.1 hypothetical protein PHALS_08053 [Plasmopara halstedii]
MLDPLTLAVSRSSSFSDEHLHAMRFLLPALEFVPGTYIAGRIVDGITRPIKFGFRKDVEILAEEAKERYKTAKYIVQVPFGKRITFTITVLRLTAKLHLGEESKNLKAKDKSDMFHRSA